MKNTFPRHTHLDIIPSTACALQETVEEELDYEADEVMDQASAPADTKVC